MKTIPVGLQLYSVRHDLEEDLEGTLSRVAEMGYEGVEFAGPPRHEAQHLRRALDEVGLVCCGWHIPFELVQEDRLEETIAFHRTLDNRFLIVPGVPEEYRRSREDWLKLADFFADLAERLGEEDMLTGYHNHHLEFQEMDGEKPWDTLFKHTDERVVMQLDTGNAYYGGQEPVAVLKKYPGRAITVHLKPYSPEAGREDPRKGFRPLIGEDGTDWQEVFRICEEGGTEWYIIEYESDAYPSLEAVDLCLQKLREILPG